ncbi:helix-turn-helix domain-containing protein [Variovorax sp. GB1P17]|uniref:helix-turn-helix domain-containing protein n=1 Tax=Variovorax sp. GB1P17 TaxID=3443740 RepID=UPI003F47C943
MNAIESIVGAYKAKMGYRFDKDVATALGLKPSAFSNYMNGRSRLPDMAIVRIAEGIHEPVEKVIAANNVTYVNTPEEERSFWARRMESVRS